MGRHFSTDRFTSCVHGQSHRGIRQLARGPRRFESEGKDPGAGRRAERGHFGDVKLLEDGVAEMRVDSGPGYRVYFAREGRMVYLLLCGGDKSTQAADIKHAKAKWAAIRKELS